MSESFNNLGRQPIAIVNIDLPIEISPFHSDEAIEEKLREVVSQISFPEEARVQAFVGFLPDPMKEIQVVKIQQGFYKEPQ